MAIRLVWDKQPGEARRATAARLSWGMADYQASNQLIAAVTRAFAEGRQLDVGRLLAPELDDGGATTVDLERIAKEAGVALRTVRYALQAYRLATRIGLSPLEVEQIGWTKFALVTSGAREDMTKADVLAICEGRTVAEVRAAVAGMAGSIKGVTFSLNKTQRRALEAALIRHGAVRMGRGLSGKEAALMKMVFKTT